MCNIFGYIYGIHFYIYNPRKTLNKKTPGVLPPRKGASEWPQMMISETGKKKLAAFQPHRMVYLPTFTIEINRSCR